MEDTEKTGAAPGTMLSLAGPVGGPRSCMAAVELQMFFSRLPAGGQLAAARARRCRPSGPAAGHSGPARLVSLTRVRVTWQTCMVRTNKVLKSVAKNKLIKSNSRHESISPRPAVGVVGTPGPDSALTRQ